VRRIAPFINAPCTGSKHAVVALSEVLYRELGASTDKVHVSLLCPAWVPTKIWDSPRNRPADLHEGSESDRERAVREQVRGILEQGKLSADDIAAATFEAVAARRFYILPHEVVLENVRTRMEDILQLRNPSPLRGLGERAARISGG